MRVLCVALTSCSLIVPPAAGKNPPTSCRPTPLVDLAAATLGFVALGRARAEASAGNSENKETVIKAVTVGYGVSSTLVLGVAVFGIVRYGQCLRDAKNPPPPDSGGRVCLPTEPGSSVWTCGSDYRCTDDFESCEPADGRPTLRQR